MKEVTLYDAYDRPIKKQDLTREYAAPTLTGVRTLWTETVAAGLTPQRLAGLLRAADDGDHRAYLTLAEEMEEREPHYASVLGTRKRAVKRLPVQVEAVSDQPRDIEIAEACQAMTRRPGFKSMIEDCLDGLGKGYSCVEIVWDRSAARWQPKYEWRDPRFFTFDRVKRNEIRLLDEADMMNGIELPPYKFITHLPKLKSGIPIRGGLARLVAWSYMAKMYTFKDWLAFVEVFGMPLRVGKYGSNATDRDIEILKTAVANLGSDAAAVLPDSMKIEFQDAAKSTGGDKLFLVLAEWIDKQISKAVLGQTMTADDGSSQAQAKVHDEVRGDIRDADAEQIEETLNRDLIKPFVDLNFGPQEQYPWLQLQIAEQEDIKALSEALDKLVPLGFRVEQSVISDRMGLPIPDKNAKPEDLLGMPKAAPATVPPVVAANRSLALNSAGADSFPDQTVIDTLCSLVTPEMMQSQMSPLLQPVIKGLQESGNPDDAMQALIAAFPDMDSAALDKMLGNLMFVAEAIGRISAGNEE